MFENIQPGARAKFAKIQGMVRRESAKLVALVPAGFIAAVGAINFTELQEMIDGISGLMPSIQGLVMAVVPVILTFVLIGFVIGILTAIVLYVKGALHF